MSASKTSASAIASVPSCGPIPSASLDAFLIQAEQTVLVVVGALERAVRFAVVKPVELVLRVERRGIQRLVPVQPRHLVLHEAVVVAVGPARGQRHGPPEPEVHVHLAGPYGVKRPDPPAAQSQRAHPYRTHSHLLLEKA